MTVSRPSNAGVASSGQPEPGRLMDAGHSGIQEPQMIVVPAVEQIEVFVNEGGSITIKQTGLQDVSIVVLEPGHVPAVCAALKKAAVEAKSP